MPSKDFMYEQYILRIVSMSILYIWLISQTMKTHHLHEVTYDFSSRYKHDSMQEFHPPG